MKQIIKAIDTAHAAQIISIYKALTQSILSANGDDAEIRASENRFKKGVAFANDVKAKALALLEL